MSEFDDAMSRGIEMAATASRLGFTRPHKMKPLRKRGEKPMPESRFFNRAQAAAYLGISEHLFSIEVAHGMWPAPLERTYGRLRLWDRRALDRRADERSGLVDSAPQVNLSDAETDALAIVMGSK